MKNRTRNILLLAIYGILLVLIGLFSPRKINWTPSFSADDKIPYGNYVLFHQLKDLFPGNKVERSNSPFYNVADNIDSGSMLNFIIINEKTDVDELDVKSLTGFVKEGGNVFISTNDLPEALEDSLGIRFKELLNFSALNKIDTQQYCRLNFTDDTLKKTSGYKFKQDYVSYEILHGSEVKVHFSLSDNDDSIQRPAKILPTEVLGTDQNGKTNFIRINYGNGNFYVHSFPFAFTNYHILKSENRDYISKCLTYLPNQETYWDEYYKPFKRTKAQTPLRFILSIPSYRWAYYIALFSLLIYMVFSAKRQQRIIPIVEPFKNLSLDFARTVGTLYFQKSNHKDLAEKKMTYFLEKVRNQYFISTTVLNEPFQEKLSFRSNVPIEVVKDIFKIYFSEIREQRSINEHSLIAFNAALEKFYKISGLQV